VKTLTLSHCNTWLDCCNGVYALKR